MGNRESPVKGFRDRPWIITDDFPDVAASIIELQALLLGTDSTDDFLRELAALAARTLGADVSCGITLQPADRPLTVASSDAFAAQVDELQYRLDSGPCLSALRAGRPVRIDDLAADGRWRRYAARARAYGVRSSLSLPVTAQDSPVGALNLYSRSASFFGEAETCHAQRFTASASVAVGLAARFAASTMLTDQLRASLASRSVIDQALGIIMAEQRCISDEAFSILRAASQNRNVKLRQVAEDIVTGLTGGPPQPPPFDPPH